MLGKRKKFEFNKKNQLDLIFLCDVFGLAEVRNIVLSYLSQNFDKNSIFDFIKLASEDMQTAYLGADPTISESAIEAYWMIVYIYFQKLGASDILPSFTKSKTKTMLREININDFSFDKGFIVHDKSGKRIELSVFVPVGKHEMN